MKYRGEWSYRSSYEEDATFPAYLGTPIFWEKKSGTLPHPPDDFPVEAAKAKNCMTNLVVSVLSNGEKECENWTSEKNQTSDHLESWKI